MSLLAHISRLLSPADRLPSPSEPSDSLLVFFTQEHAHWHISSRDIASRTSALQSASPRHAEPSTTYPPPADPHHRHTCRDMAATIFCGIGDMTVDAVISDAVRPYGEGPFSPAKFLVMYLGAVALYNTATDAATAWAEHAAKELGGMLDFAGISAAGAGRVLDEEHHLLVEQLASDAFLGGAEPLNKVFKGSRMLKSFGAREQLTAILDFIPGLEPALAVAPTPAANPAPGLGLPHTLALALPPAPAPASAPANAAASPAIEAAPQPAPLGHRADERDPDWTLPGRMHNHTAEQLKQQLERFRTWNKGAPRDRLRRSRGADGGTKLSTRPSSGRRGTRPRRRPSCGPLPLWHLTVAN